MRGGRIKKGKIGKRERERRDTLNSMEIRKSDFAVERRRREG